ncbi:hypothetical protein [Clostridium sp. DL1XJH146]
MNFTKSTFDSDMEILYSNANLVAFSGTVLAANVTEADENGKKYVLAGSLIDVDGNVVTETGVEGSETLSTTPVGVLFHTVDVTNGDQPGSLVVEGYLRKDRVVDDTFDNTLDDIKTALPKITFR